MKRFTDWRARLADLIEQRRRVPADGTNNCGLFVADAVLAMTGEDLAEGWRNHYATIADAVAAVRAAGFADVCELAAARLTEIHPSRARHGDVAAIPLNAGAWALGIVAGERVTVLRPDGLGTVSLDAATRAFQVAV